MSQLISNLPLGSRIKFGKHQIYQETPEPIVWQIANITSSRITLVTEKIIDIRAFDAAEPINGDASERVSHGNNRYKYSNIRSYLNRGVGHWVSSYKYDAPPTNEHVSPNRYGYADRDGFLTYFEIDEVKALLDTERNPYLPAIDDKQSEYSETMTDKIWLLETYDVNKTYGFDLFKNPTQSGTSTISSKAIKTVSNQCSTQAYNQGGSTPRTYMLADPYMPGQNPSLISLVPMSITSSTVYEYANANVGLVVGANITPTMKVSNAADSDGCYPIVFDTPSAAPTLNITDQALGNVPTAFNIVYQIDDTNEDDALTITEDFVNSAGEVIKNIRVTNNAVRKTEYTLGLTSIWDTIAIGPNIVRIKVEDDNGNSSSVKISFTKQLNLVIKGLEPYDRGNVYAPIPINYEIFGTGTIRVDETLDGKVLNSLAYYNATPATAISRTLDLTNLVEWIIYSGTQAHKLHIKITQVNAGFPTGEFVEKDITFTVVPAPDVGNFAPKISIPQTSFGDVINGFECKWTVSDLNVGNAMSTTAKLDGTIIYNSSWSNDFTGDKEHILDMITLWPTVSVGSHRIDVSATDGFVTVTDSIHFTRKKDKIDVIAFGFPTDELSKRVIPMVSISKSITSLDTYNIYVCNNYNDELPTWENINTLARGKSYTFINKTKTAPRGLVAVKIESIPYS